jgi:hypothetical protein
MQHVLKLMILSLLAILPWVAQAMHLCPGDRVPQLLNMGYPWPLVQQHCSDGTPLPPLQSLQQQPQWSPQPPQGQWPQPSPPPPPQGQWPPQPSPSPPQGQWPQQPPPLPSQGQRPQQPPPLPRSQQPAQPAGGSGITLRSPDGRQITLQSPPCTRAMVMEMQQFGMPQQDIQEIIANMCGGRIQG